MWLKDDNLARSAKWPTGLYVLPSVSIFFFFFYFFYLFFFKYDFSETNYLKIRWTDFRNLYVEWKLFGCRWSIWTSFSISQGTLPWQPILCKNGAKLPTPLHLLSSYFYVQLLNAVMLESLQLLHRVTFNNRANILARWRNCMQQLHTKPRHYEQTNRRTDVMLVARRAKRQ